MDNVVFKVPFGKVEIFGNCVIHTANEGVDVGQEQIDIIEKIINENTVGDIGFISNQINDYSISAVHYSVFL